MGKTSTSGSESMPMKKRKRRYIGFALVLALLLITAGCWYYWKLPVPDESAPPPLEEYEFHVEPVSLDQPVNVLLLGVERQGGGPGRSDTIMVLRLDPNGDARLVSFMRDMYVRIPGHEGKHRLNAAFSFGGPELVRQTLQENFGIDTQYYVAIDFYGFQTIVDALGGVDVNVERRIPSDGTVPAIAPGWQRLNGAQALRYVRFRHDAEGDFGRVRRQQQVIQALADELKSLKGFVQLPRVIRAAYPYVRTNFSVNQLVGLALNNDWNVVSLEKLRVPVDGTFAERRIHGMAVLIPDLEANRKAIQEFLEQPVNNLQARGGMH